MKLSAAQNPLVLAIDIGSTASRARVYDATGTGVRGLHGRIAHAFTTRADGTAEIDPDATLREVTDLLDQLCQEPKLHGRIGGVAMDTFASSLVGVGEDGAALTPCYTYADSRPAAQVRTLRQEMDEASVQQRTGCRFHTGYLPARLRWLRTTAPEVTTKVAHWLSLGEYIYAALLGKHAVSYSTAAWTGLLDRRTGAWDKDLITRVGGDVEQFSPVVDTSAPLTAGDAVGRRWPALAGARWFPAVADGFASNIGSGASTSDTIALSAATSGALRVLLTTTPPTIPPGLWSYRVDQRRSLIGGALNDVGRVATWLRSRLQLPDDTALSQMLVSAPGIDLPVVLPFLTGERSPDWAAGACATFSEITDATTALDLFRGSMEGVALRFAATAKELEQVAPETTRILASGGVTEVLPGWLQIVADTLGRPVTRVDQKQATMRGTALIALDVLAPDVGRAPASLAETYAPNPAHTAYYQRAAARQQTLYQAVVGGEAKGAGVAG